MAFLQDFLKAISPVGISGLSAKKSKDAAIYLLIMVTLAFIIMGFVFIPKIMSISKDFDNALSKFSAFEIRHNIVQTAPLDMGALTINLDSNSTVPPNKYMLTRKAFYSKNIFGVSQLNVEGMGNILENKGAYQNIVWALFLLILPSIILILYVSFLIKFALAALIMSFVALIIVRLIRFEISYKEIFNISCYSVTPAALFVMINFPLNIAYVNIAGYFLSVVLLVAGVSRTGYADRKKHRKNRRRGYVELR